MKIAINQTYWENFVDMQTSWDGRDGFINLKDDDTLPEGCIDVYTELINDLDKLRLFIKYIARDYSMAYDLYVDAVSNIGFANLNEEQKYFICEKLAIRVGKEIDYNTIIGYYMSQEMDINDAKKKLRKEVREHRKRIANNYSTRLDKAEIICGKYLSVIDSLDFSDTVESLETKARRRGVVWKSYRDEREGMIDWIKSENAYTGNGLREKNYVLEEGTIDELIEELVDIIIYGFKSQ